MLKGKFGEAGKTVVLCTASWTEQVPGWMVGSGKGWVTAEYSMLPGSTPQRKQRDGRSGRPDGRSVEIQRLIGRSLRAGIALAALPEISLWVDCDVLSADGGTRTWAITGAWVALYDALGELQKTKGMRQLPIHQWICATSVGMVQGSPLLDLCYEEDSNADVDMNVVYTSKGEFAEVQMSGEKTTLGRHGLDSLLDLAEEGCKHLLQIQEQVLETPLR